MIGTFSPKGQICGPIMPRWLLKMKNVSLGAKTVYTLMISCSSAGHDYCWPSQGWLAENMGVTTRSVQNYLRELEALKLIESKQSRAGSSLRYYFLLSDVVEIWSSTPATAPKLTPANISEGYEKFSKGSENFSDVYNKNINIIENNTPLPPKVTSAVSNLASSDVGGGGFSSALESAEKAFTQLWEMWPRKEARNSAHKLWKQLWFSGKLPSFESILKKIELLKTEDRAWSRGYAPYLVNWLRDERWQDEIKLQTTESVTYTPKISKEESEKILTAMRKKSMEETKNFLDTRGGTNSFFQKYKNLIPERKVMEAPGYIYEI